MSGLNPSSIDLALSSKREIARVLRSLQDTFKFALAIGGGIVTVGKEVNPTLGNNFQMEWDIGNARVIIHNDYPVYSGGDYYYIDVAVPATDKYITLASLSESPTPFNHFFLVESAPNIGNIEIVPASTIAEPSPVGIKLLYIGYAYRGVNNIISVTNIGRLIDVAYLIKNTSYIDYLDENTSEKISADPTNILNYVAFFGPNVTKTVTEVILFIKDDISNLRGFAYSAVPSHTLLSSENLKVSWKITI